MSGINEVINAQIQKIFPGQPLTKSTGLVKVNVHEVSTNAIIEIAELAKWNQLSEVAIKRSGLGVVVKFHGVRSHATPTRFA